MWKEAWGEKQLNTNRWDIFFFFFLSNTKEMQKTSNHGGKKKKNESKSHFIFELPCRLWWAWQGMSWGTGGWFSHLGTTNPNLKGLQWQKLFSEGGYLFFCAAGMWGQHCAARGSTDCDNQDNFLLQHLTNWSIDFHLLFIHSFIHFGSFGTQFFFQWKWKMW